MTDRPKIYDNDRGSILIYYRHEQLRGWSYQSDAERRKKMKWAWEFMEGWIAGYEQGKSIGHDEGFDHGHSEGVKAL